ncbi:phage terminase large subunit, partial [Streptomyces californicus]|uniref:phage terminase large subunit n=1 Tax=Streptomyces californicus TaxID=67351 RepID=UPI00364B09A0
MTINMPPRHGKSFTANLFAQWLFGKDKNRQIITVSYARDLADRFSQQVRDGIAVEKGEPLEITYSDVFPEVFIKHGDSAKRGWSLEGSSRLNYYATSFGSQITGMGCQIGIIDDPVKDHLEAFNEIILDDKMYWYDNTFLSRVEKGGKKIVIATRWATKDLTGRLIAREPEEWYELKLPACLNEETGEMLCEELFDFEMYNKMKGVMSEEIFMANYQQIPVDVKGRLYTKLLTHNDVPIPTDGAGNLLFERIISYTDTADTGADHLVSIVAGQYKGQLWILDVLYTKEPMEVTENWQAKFLVENEVTYAKFESNNGGRGFARTIEKILLETYNTRKPKIEWFHQSKNKKARILSASTFIMNNVFFPVDWHITHAKFCQDLMAFQKEGKNKHDDAPDALTGLA